MDGCLLAALTLFLGGRVEADVELPETGPLVVDRDVRIRPGTYVRPALGEQGREGVIVARHAKGVTLDLTGVDLRGTLSGTDIDRNVGYGILLEDCADVTVRGGKLGGYRDCIVANRCKNVVLDGIAFDGWYGMHLFSTSAAEDESDWLYPHENDRDEWMTNYGSAIALNDCAGATVKDCRGRHGQNGILLTRTNGSSIYDCDFSFLSGWGIALYRSSKQVVSRNRFEYCVRGYSHGVYWRGQDSAGILVFERSSDNVFGLNSATHGGDGVFLFAGNDTVLGRAFDKGETDAGGSDRNVFWRNDLSCAVANSLEATFSRDNWVLENNLSGSHQHGVWGGYSSRMIVAKNHVERTLGGGISIEHGQECAIAGNWIHRNQIGVELWWDEDPDLVGGPFGKHRDTSSRDTWVVGNEFFENDRDVVLTRTKNVVLGENRWGAARGSLEGEGIRLDVLLGPNGARASGTIHGTDLDAWDGKTPAPLAAAAAWKSPELPGKQVAIARESKGSQGLETIIVGEWGPWDFASGEPKPVERKLGGLLAGCTWAASWFSWKNGPDPRTDPERWRALVEKPIASGTVLAWTDPFGGDRELVKKVGADHFGLVAKTRLEIAAGGAHRLRVRSDDGVRVRVDGREVFEDWTCHAPRRGEAELELAPGPHDLEIEYFQIDGAMALAVDLEKKD